MGSHGITFSQRLDFELTLPLTTYWEGRGLLGFIEIHFLLKVGDSKKRKRKTRWLKAMADVVLSPLTHYDITY